MELRDPDLYTAARGMVGLITESFFCFRMGEKDALASPNGVDGKYRRTASSPPPPPPPVQGGFSTPTNGHAAAHSRQGSSSSNGGGGGSKTPAKTPKRESPATIAAKGKREREF